MQKSFLILHIILCFRRIIINNESNIICKNHYILRNTQKRKQKMEPSGFEQATLSVCFLNSSIHFSRFLWTVIVIIFWLSAFTVLIFTESGKMKKSMIFVTDSIDYPIWHFVFPAVTICNFNKISRERALFQALKMYVIIFFHKLIDII